MGEEVERLKDHAHLLSYRQAVFLVVVERDAVYDNGTAVDLLEPVETSEERGFTRPGWPNNDNDLAAADFGGEITEGVDTAGKCLIDFVDRDDVVSQDFFLHRKKLPLLRSNLRF